MIKIKSQNQKGTKTKMAKRLSITISDWVYQQYLSDIKSNRSKFIEEMMVKGIEQEIGDYDIRKGKLSTLVQELRNKEEQINKLSLLISVLKRKTEIDNNKEREALERIADGIKANNPLRDEE